MYISFFIIIIFQRRSNSMMRTYLYMKKFQIIHLSETSPLPCGNIISWSMSMLSRCFNIICFFYTTFYCCMKWYFHFVASLRETERIQISGITFQVNLITMRLQSSLQSSLQPKMDINFGTKLITFYYLMWIYIFGIWIWA